ncbi:PREDICTED: protein SIX6OS1 [Crocodylus porosus]|uniref:protein SIX6OS1 n=1 Tax=Crocodylus porosus TaxID=8502 RepID=UPI000938F9D7|nr:PREDICTED: protein SIX6OS1 [Crocodylus porosus]
MYQDYIIQYNNILKQHQEKYSETALSQKYYMKKRDLEEIRNRVLKDSEQFKSKEAALLDMLEPAPFQSLSDWALKIVSMRQKTQEVLKHTAVLTQKSLKLEKEADELEMKINNLKQPFERTTANQNHSEITDGKYKRNLEQKNENPYLVHEKQQQQQPLHLPSIPQKFVQSIRTFRQSLQETQAVGEERENPMDHSAITSVSSSQLENETQKCSDTTRTNHPKIAQVPSRENQMQFRLLSPQKQTTSKQWFENEAVITANKDAECGGKEEASKAKDSLHVSQNIPTESFRSTEDNPNTAEEGTVNFPRTPEMPAFIRTPESNEKKARFPKTPPFELNQNSGSEKATPKSPAFSFFMACTEKSPGFNLFDPSVFEAENSSDQMDECYSAGNVNPVSPHKDIGSLFGKSESEDGFTFSFPSESSSNTFGDGKDDFSFLFAFGQDQRSSQSSSMKGFHSSSQSTKPFTFF